MLQTAILAARQAGVIIMDQLNDQHQVKWKAGREIVTEVDLRAQEAIIGTIKARFPDHDILAEEGSELTGNSYAWIIDPLDGTDNYVNQFPCFCASIALQHDSIITLGVVYDPLNDRFFKAQRGHNADMNDKYLHVSQIQKLTEAMIIISWPRDDEARENTLRLAIAMTHNARTLRTLGSAALSLCYVAAGWADGFIHANIEPWDAAAGALIVRETGGKVTDFAGQPWRITSRQLVASNGLLHDEIIQNIR